MNPPPLVQCASCVSQPWIAAEKCLSVNRTLKTNLFNFIRTVSVHRCQMDSRYGGYLRIYWISRHRQTDRQTDEKLLSSKSLPQKTSLLLNVAQ